MKVLFIKFLPNVGHIWDIKEVSHAYATNFLIPKWYVKTLTPQEEQKIIQDEKKLEEKRRNLILNKHKILETLNHKEFKFVLNKQSNNKAFWSIKEKDVIDKIKADFKIELEKKHIDFGPEGHIKKIWSRFVYIKLSSEDQAKITITVE